MLRNEKAMSRRPTTRRKAASKPPASAGRLATLSITALGSHGDGLAVQDGVPIFVPYALPGEVVVAQIEGRRGDGTYARLIEVEQKAAERVDPACRHFGTCGGCALQHLAEAAQATWKRDLLVQAMTRVGIEPERVAPLIAIPPGGRRRATFAFARHRGTIVLGFNTRSSHAVVDVEMCPLLVPELVDLLPRLRAYLLAAVDDGAMGDATITQTASGIDVLLDGDTRLDLFGRQRAAEFADQADLARLSWRLKGMVEPLSCRRPPQIVFGNVAVELPPGGFLQPSVAGEAALSRLVQDGVGRATSVADLYAGCGSFSFPLAGCASVHAVEGDTLAARALQNAAARVGAKVTVEERDLARRPLHGAELRSYQAVVFDPPRAGAAAQAESLAESGPGRVVAVSCNPATLARDTRILTNGGYRLIHVTPVDQFPWTAHLEAVAVFERP
jgi:23S rRNA (uracil1939-C5)-methyltransferase